MKISKKIVMENRKVAEALEILVGSCNVAAKSCPKHGDLTLLRR